MAVLDDAKHKGGFTYLVKILVIIIKILNLEFSMKRTVNSLKEP